MKPRTWNRTEMGYWYTEMYLDEKTGKFLGGIRWSAFQKAKGTEAWVRDPHHESLGNFIHQGKAREAVEQYWEEK